VKTGTACISAGLVLRGTQLRCPEYEDLSTARTDHFIETQM